MLYGSAGPFRFHSPVIDNPVHVDHISYGFVQCWLNRFKVLRLVGEIKQYILLAIWEKGRREKVSEGRVGAKDVVPYKEVVVAWVGDFES